MPLTPHRTRRRTRAAALLAATGLVLTAALSGCSSAVQEARSGGDGTVTEGGTLHLGVSSDLLSATPFSNASDATDVLIGLVYDTLVDTPGDSLEPKPSLGRPGSSRPTGSRSPCSCARA